MLNRCRWLATAFLFAGTGVSLLAQSSSGGTPGPTGRDAGLANDVDRIVAAYVQRGDFMGTVLVARQGTVVFRKAYGFADTAWRVPNTADTKFNIGSLTKQFTGAAVLQLVAAGKVRLDDPVTRHVPMAPAAWAPITIAHLLAHRSGLQGPGGPADYPRGIDATYTTRELVDLVAAKPLEFPPGTRFKYSNAGYYVLGHLIEQVSGQSYADYLRTQIFQPLGMGQSGYGSVRDLIEGRAFGYGKDGSRLQYAMHVDWSLASAAGALYSTVDRDRGRLRMYHQGTNPGYAGFIYRYPDDGLLIVVLSNLETAPVRSIADALAALASGDVAVPR